MLCVSHMVWCLPVQEEADWLRLYLFGKKVENIIKRATRMHSTNLVRFYPTTAKLGSARPNTDCLTALNGVCTKRNTAQFGLLLVEKEVNNNSQTWPLIHLTSLANFYSTSEVSYTCESIIIMNINKMANFSFKWLKYTY